ncbi:MAG: glycoside hydrolase [Thermoplasmata archaeon]|nr:glycoside hydrolase [Thermoplasmata archaeon]
MTTNQLSTLQSSVADRRRPWALAGVVVLTVLMLTSLVPSLLASGHAASGAHPGALGTALAPSVAPPSSTTVTIPRANLNALQASHAQVPISQVVRSEASLRASGVPLSQWFGGSVGGGPAVGASPSLAPVRSTVLPASGSTNSNFLIAGSNCTDESSVVQAGSNNRSLLAVGDSLLGTYNGTGGSPCYTPAPTPFFIKHGISAAFRSTDGGRTWATDYLGLATQWTKVGDASNGSINHGEGTVASSPSNLSLFAATYFPQCFWLGATFDSNCTTTAQMNQFYNNWGVDVGRSTDGGVSWSAPVQVSGIPTFMLYNLPSCSGMNGTFTNYANVTERPWLALNGFNHVAVVGWDILHYAINYTACTIGAVSAYVQISVSADGGLTWSVPRTISSNGAESFQVAVGPAPTYPIHIIALDFNNATVQASNGELDLSILYGKSTTNGTSFPAMADVGGALAVHNAPVTTPASWLGFSFPSLAVDNWTASAHVGSVYIAWADNQSGSLQGHAAIDLIRSTNGGGTFTTPVRISLPGNAHTYFQPKVTVGPDGKVWVVYVGNDPSTGYYRTYGIFSTDGGATWSAQFVVTDQDSIPNVTQRIGFNLGLVATTAGTFATWSDCRTTLCTTTSDPRFFDGNLYAAEFRPISITSNAVGVPLTVAVTGFSLPVKLPNVTAVDDGILVGVSAPSTFPDVPGYVWAFQGYSGAVTSPNQVASFTAAGAPSLTVTYVAVQASWITGTFFPRTSSSLLTVENVAVAMSPFNATTLTFNWSVAAGQTYTINASAGPKYQSIIGQIVTTTPGQASPLHINLLRTLGWIAGRANPANATIKINGTVVTPNPTTAIYNYTAGFQWGYYWVNGTSPGLAPSYNYIIVNPGVTTNVPITLGGGWIVGAVAQPKATLRVGVDGMPLNSTTLVNGVFNISVRGGFHMVTATETGYNLSRQNVLVHPGQSTLVNITLTNKGWISGLISPQAALSKAFLKVTNKTALGGFQTIDTATGTFNVSVAGGYNWTVNVTAAGYNAAQAVVYVTAGNASSGNPVSLTLTPTSSCTTNCPPPPCTTNCPTTSAGPNNLLLYGVIIAVVVVAAIVAALLLMRGRRGGGGGSGEEPAEDPALGEQTYQSSPTADLPKLQSDGSFSEGEPPQ